MIRPLRRRHRVTMVLLAVALPAILAAGLIARRPVPAVETLPDGVDEGALAGVPRMVTHLDGGGLVSMHLIEAPSGISVALEVEGVRGRPEWLVYWSPESSSPGGRLPDGAWLLGALEENRRNLFDLPETAAGPVGRVILYRPVSGEVLGSLRLRSTEGEGISP